MLRSAPSTPLRTGYTTGACAAAAAKGAALMLATQASFSEITIELPGGINATFQLHGQSYSAEEARCFVVKDAGDDPDVTNGAEVWATVEMHHFDSAQGTDCRLSGVEAGPHSRYRMVITGGVGIGRVTKPGLAIPPGEWAINPVPRTMIEQAIHDIVSEFNLQPSTFNVVIAIPDGVERAQKTLNSRLGILGGLSILGTTGIVRPISAKAWTDTIDAALDVAKACGCRTVVLSTGRSSEMAVQRLFKVHGSRFKVDSHELRTLNHEPLPDEAYIMMGDHVAYALQACQKRGFNRPIMACQFAKLLKIACGYENTHAAASELDLAVLLTWAETAGVPGQILELIAHANTAREIAVVTGFDRDLMGLVADRARQAAAGHAPGMEIQPLLCGYDGEIVLYSENQGNYS
jgi:cobalt-precorrin-5B (C1)-methyltransferase